MSNVDLEQLRRDVADFDWYHTIDLGNGIVTPGAQKRIIPTEFFPALAGKTVLDIGAWDGLYSFTAERAGAARVVALDHYVWGVDMRQREIYWEQCRQLGVLPDLTRDMTDFWNPELPRKRGFDLAREALGSSVEAVVGDFMTTDLDALGAFDVVLFLGVLYHLTEPYTGLQRLRRLTREVAVIETEALEVPSHESDRLLAFYPGDELLAGDYGNWFAFSESALHAMCKAAGFSRVETKLGPPAPEPTARSLFKRNGKEEPPARRYRTIVHAYVDAC